MGPTVALPQLPGRCRIGHAMRLPLLFAALSALAACAPPAQVSMSQPESGVGFGTLGTSSSLASPKGSTSLARDFMDLTFVMESGRELSTFTRFEGPVTVALTGTVPASAARDLSQVINRLQSEAGIDITYASGNSGRITIEFASRTELRRLAPTAACFVVPNVSSLAEYRQKRATDAVDWALVTRRDSAAIFIPADTSPQEIRDCLHEELAQALGPLNDLYRLPDSVFNDDNFHSVLTGFDMEILRLTYSADLQTGMSRSEVAARIGGPAQGGSTDAADWTRSIETALGRTGSLATRQAAAERALSLALAAGWQDSRTAFSHFAVGRLFAASDPDRAFDAFKTAASIYARLPGGAVQVAHVDMQLAAMALASGLSEDAVRLADRAMPVVEAHENYALLATLMLIKAEALDQLGDPVAADALRLDSQAFASYGFGPDTVVKTRMREIATVADRAAAG